MCRERTKSDMEEGDRLRELFGSDSDDDGHEEQHRVAKSSDVGVNGDQGTMGQGDEGVQLKDLFGSDDEEDGGTGMAEAMQTGNKEGENQLEEEEEEEEEKNGPMEIGVRLHDALPLAALSLVKLPNSLAIEPDPFVHSEFEGNEDDRPTIRWKNVLGMHGERLRESNARLVTWSDGSKTLQVGRDWFSVKTIDINRDHSYLYVRNAGLVQCQGKLESKIAFNPIGIGKDDRPRVRSGKHDESRVKVKQTATMVDPLKEREEKHRAEEARIKDKEKLVEKQRQHMRRSIMQARVPQRRDSYLSAAFLEEDDEYDQMREQEEDDDGFIVSDDDDELDIEDVEDERPDLDDEEGAKRLSAIKDSERSEKRLTRDTNILEDSYGGGAGEHQEEPPAKKRAVLIDSDDD